MKESMKKLESQFEAFLKITLCEDTEYARVFAEYTVKQSEIVLITGADVHDGEITVHGYHCSTKGWITFTITEPDDVFIIPEQLNVTVHNVLQLAMFGNYCQAVRIICLEALFSNDLPELPNGATCELIESHKINQFSKAVSVTFKDTKVGVSIPLGAMASYVIKNNTVLNSDFIKKVVDYSIEQLQQSDVVSAYASADFNDVSKIYGYLINAEINEHMREYAVYREVADLLLVYRYSLQDSPQESTSAIISKVSADRRGWNEEFLYEQWLRNTDGANSYEITPIIDILQELSDDYDIPDDMECNLNVYVLTNKMRLNASGVVLRPEIMRDLQKILGNDFYLVPSSVNDFLAFPMDMSVDNVKRMVSEVNAQFVSNDEFLSNSVYRYDFDTMELKVI